MMRLAVTVALAVALLAVPLGAQSPVDVASRFRIEQFTTNNGLPANSMGGLAQTPDGYLWVATFDGIARFDGVSFTIFDRGNTPVIRRTQFLNAEVDGSGALWSGTDQGSLRVKDGEFRWFHADAGGPPGAGRAMNNRQHAEFVAPPTARWRVETGVLVGPARPPEAGVVRVPLPAVDAHVAGVDRNGLVWIYSQDLMMTWDGRVLGRIPAEALIGNGIRAALIDRDGTLWIGSMSNGLFRLTPRVVTTISVEEGLYARYAYPVAEDSAGRVWIGSGDGLTRWEKNRLTSFCIERAGESLRMIPLGRGSRCNQAETIRAIHVDRAGRVWLALTRAIGRIDGDRFSVIYNGLRDTPTAMLLDRTGSLWYGSGREIRRASPQSVSVFREADGVPGGLTHALFEDARGHIWAATMRGVGRFDGYKWTTYRQADGIAGDIVRSIHQDSSGALWFGTFDGGITRVRNGTFRTITTRDGLFDNGAFQILDDGRGRFWMSSNRGIYRVNRSQLNDVADGLIPRVISVGYGVADGMKSVEANGGRPPAGTRTRDGRLWFPTTDGVVVIDPAAEPTDVQPPAPIFHRVVVDARQRRVDGGTVRLEPGETNVIIGYTAPTSMQARQVQFRYRLRGLDDGWTDAGTSREVHFAQLPPGDYTLELMASSTRGDWSQQPSSLRVIVEPHFWQTGWFAALVAAAIVGTGVTGYRIRIAGLREQERRLTALVEERTAELGAANYRLMQLATSDGLTGVANKRRFDEFLANETHRAMRTRSSIALLAMDVDHFKKYNDTYGHPAGDACLKAVAGILASHVRAGTDLAARPGGEEFAAVLTETGIDGALVVAEKIRAHVEALGIEHRASSVAPVVTISVGIATMVPSEKGSAAELIAAADKALYKAKESGRNRVVAPAGAGVA